MTGKRRRLKEAENAIKTATGKSDEEFLREYLVKDSAQSPNPWAPTWKHPGTDAVYNLSLSQTQSTSDADLEACFSLVEETSRDDYEASSRGWDPSFKRQEMREPDLRYILVKDAAGQVCGYTSLMPTMEAGEALIYCYEIHLQPELRRTGLAGLLMGFLETVAGNIAGMEKVMLTVFTCNTRAVAFYRRCGFEVDGISPRRRKLRNGVVKEPDYAILSKRVNRAQKGVSGDADQADWAATPPAKMAKLDKENYSTNNGIASKE